MSKQSEVVLATLLGLCLWSTAPADTMVLKNGQVLDGKVTKSGDDVTIEMPYMTLRFATEEIASIEYGPSPVDVYKERLAALSKDDAEGHYQLGLYCEEKAMMSHAREQFEEAISIKGDHEAARAKLGYVKNGDTWITREQDMANKGYVLYRGRYITVERADALAERDTAVKRESDATITVRSLVYLIAQASDPASFEARDKLAGVSDPAALPALIDATYHSNAAARSSALLALLNYREDDAALAALDVAFDDPVPDVRYQAFIVLNKKQSEAVFQSALKALDSYYDNTRFRAAEILGAIGDSRAVPYLIEALSWTRVKYNPPAQRRSNRISTYLPPSYVVGFRAKVAPGVVAYEPIYAVRDRYGRIVTEPYYTRIDEWDELPPTTEEVILNYEALSALQALTGQDLRFDKEAWRSYYLANRQRLTPSSRQ